MDLVSGLARVVSHSFPNPVFTQLQLNVSGLMEPPRRVRSQIIETISDYAKEKDANQSRSPSECNYSPLDARRHVDLVSGLAGRVTFFLSTDSSRTMSRI